MPVLRGSPRAGLPPVYFGASSSAVKSIRPQEAVAELAQVMSDNRFVSNPDALVKSAMERESMLSTAVGGGIAFPHVRGVEGGGLTLALGVSPAGIKWDTAGSVVNVVVFSVIPVAVSMFYLRLVAMLCDTFKKKDNLALVCGATSSAALWKSLVKATRYSVK